MYMHARASAQVGSRQAPLSLWMPPASCSFPMQLTIGSAGTRHRACATSSRVAQSSWYQCLRVAQTFLESHDFAGIVAWLQEIVCAVCSRSANPMPSCCSGLPSVSVLCDGDVRAQHDSLSARSTQHLNNGSLNTFTLEWDARAHRQQMTASTPAALAQHSTFLSISQSRCLMAWWLPSTHFRCATSALRHCILHACIRRTNQLMVLHSDMMTCWLLNTQPLPHARQSYEYRSIGCYNDP